VARVPDLASLNLSESYLAYLAENCPCSIQIAATVSQGPSALFNTHDVAQQ